MLAPLARAGGLMMKRAVAPVSPTSVGATTLSSSDRATFHFPSAWIAMLTRRAAASGLQATTWYLTCTDCNRCSHQVKPVAACGQDFRKLRMVGDHGSGGRSEARMRGLFTSCALRKLQHHRTSRVHHFSVLLLAVTLSQWARVERACAR